MKYLVTLSLSFFIIVDALSQNNDKPAQSPATLSLSIGPAIPLGSFASMNGFSSTAGLANIGATAALEYQHRIPNTRFGWTASLRGRLNSISKSATEAPFETQFPGYQWSMNNSHWTTAAALIGGYYELPLTPKLNAQTTLGIGVAECWSPKQSVTGIRDSTGFGPTDLIQATVRSVNATTLTALAGAGISYKWRPRWSLMARAEYQWLKPTFKNVNPQLVWSRGLVIPGILSPANARQISIYSSAHNYTQPMPTLDILISVVRHF